MAATFTPANNRSYTHNITDENGATIGMLFNRKDAQGRPRLFVELSRDSMSVNTMEDAQIFVDMVLTGEWANVKAGRIPNPLSI